MNNKLIKSYCQISRSIYALIKENKLPLEEVGYYIAVKSLNLINHSDKTTKIDNLCKAFNISKPTIIKYNNTLISNGLMCEVTKMTLDPEIKGPGGFVKISTLYLTLIHNKKISLKHLGYLFCLSSGFEYESNISNLAIRGVARYSGISKTTSRKYFHYLTTINQLSREESGLKVKNIYFGVNNSKEFDPLDNVNSKEFDPLLSLYKKKILKRNRQKYHPCQIKSTVIEDDVDDVFFDSETSRDQLTKNQLESVKIVLKKFGPEKTKTAVQNIFKTYDIQEIGNIHGLFLSYFDNCKFWGSKPSKMKRMVNMDRIKTLRIERAAKMTDDFMKMEKKKEIVPMTKNIKLSELAYLKCKNMMRVNFPNIKETHPMYQAQIQLYATA